MKLSDLPGVVKDAVTPVWMVNTEPAPERIVVTCKDCFVLVAKPNIDNHMRAAHRKETDRG